MIIEKTMSDMCEFLQKYAPNFNNMQRVNKILAKDLNRLMEDFMELFQQMPIFDILEFKMKFLEDLTGRPRYQLIDQKVWKKRFNHERYEVDHLIKKEEGEIAVNQNILPTNPCTPEKYI